MARISSVHITNQPNIREVHNSFGLMGNEKFLHEWTFSEGGCGCGGTYHTTVTDTRLLIRYKDAKCCCCEPNNKDTSIFLRDIAEMRESTENRDCCSRLCAKCCGCCCHASKFIEVRGVFGSEILHVPKDDMKTLQMEVPTAIGNHKFVTHP